MDACQALSKARDLRAEFDKREKPLATAKELVGEGDAELKALTQKCERVKKLTDFYLQKVRIPIFPKFSENSVQIHKIRKKVFKNIL